MFSCGEYVRGFITGLVLSTEREKVVRFLEGCQSTGVYVYLCACVCVYEFTALILFFVYYKN